MDSFLIGLAVGILYGCAAMSMFVILGFFGVAAYYVVYNEFPEITEIDSLTWFYGQLGPLRIVAYAVCALMWPLLLVILLFFVFLRNSTMERFFDISKRGVFPKKTRERIEWLFLGFGKIKQR